MHNEKLMNKSRVEDQTMSALISSIMVPSPSSDRLSFMPEYWVSLSLSQVKKVPSIRAPIMKLGWIWR